MPPVNPRTYVPMELLVAPENDRETPVELRRSDFSAPMSEQERKPGLLDSDKDSQKGSVYPLVI